MKLALEGYRMKTELELFFESNTMDKSFLCCMWEEDNVYAFLSGVFVTLGRTLSIETEKEREYKDNILDEVQLLQQIDLEKRLS